ncbi:hypothetical protein A2362_02090 [Candidatus Curtissbacteria bacterium RIFOXYB1_FULL_41_59]|uniref:Uncharacterized protein n=1 Tax=Candidatus Curtissbacteria bacterium RIFOXYA1_FULL_41_14 TaxID=1797737 RepID=A0A1F5HEA7_9BACT|nr:MAG: hypothetical protein UT95_C0040G0003 [Candidatus Curtissbacteria bacterium GW2011_GWB1_40_28]OGE02382.1 MAG: hypothetical protein A2196_03760 [Candidatus Curtissbacteria bacterium RIFOXYA1_FULL_41_14]OGE04895.1 MAG: hypothetical protein A2362_02090 [Candidatus Curtissbacteria bacterium RIFOXYB1_FULL_41_59]OGE07737.1 MAG: hypothetical protein A2615_04850 [Candidatus Curtissbacteria bacterium RIFOXYD1_FULL_41_36]OGE12891.1 MAG: hypothetical protein A2305_02505 [Candidatus Curtissbacteria 
MTHTIFRKVPKTAFFNNNAKSLPNICFINPYFGKLPVWMPLFLESCKKNSAFSWVLFGDHKNHYKLPKNVRWEKMSMDIFNKLARKQTGLPFSIKTPYKICDAKPMYGDIFKHYLNGFTFWGNYDLDIIYGDLDSFSLRTKIINCDIYTPFSAPVGHFTLYRNVEGINKLYLKLENLHLAYQDAPSCLGYDHKPMLKLINSNRHLRFFNVNYKKELSKSRCETGASIMPSGQLVGELFSAKERYLWENGKVFQLNGKRRREFLYLHFFCWKNNNYWRRFNTGSKPISKFWLDLGGYTPNRKYLLPTNNLSRMFRYILRFTNLVIRAKKRLLF